MKMKLVVLGAPGAGKGTQAQKLADYYNIAHISTGDILRDHIRNETDLGVDIVETMNQGGLVSDEIAIKLVKERLQDADCQNGYVLDGFPRTLFQAEALEHIADGPDGALWVVSVKVSDDVIIDRVAGRVVCPKCGAMFNIHYRPPKVAGTCDKCDGKLIQRTDDNVTAVTKRLALYHELTEPICRFYSDKGMLMEVDGTADTDEITRTIINFLGDQSFEKSPGRE